MLKYANNNSVIYKKIFTLFVCHNTSCDSQVTIQNYIYFFVFLQLPLLKLEWNLESKKWKRISVCFGSAYQISV